jgi:hypothetical protein
MLYKDGYWVAKMVGPNQLSSPKTSYFSAANITRDTIEVLPLHTHYALSKGWIRWSNFHLS